MIIDFTNFYKEISETKNPHLFEILHYLMTIIVHLNNNTKELEKKKKHFNNYIPLIIFMNKK